MHAYEDNETEMEEEKKLVVARPKELLPFGMNIREAAHKAAFGGSKKGALQRYATFFKNKKNLAREECKDIDELLNEDDLSDSESVSDEDLSKSASLESLELEVGDKGIPNASATERKMENRMQFLRKKSNRILSSKQRQEQAKPEPEEDDWFSCAQ